MKQTSWKAWVRLGTGLHDTPFVKDVTIYDCAEKPGYVLATITLDVTSVSGPEGRDGALSPREPSDEQSMPDVGAHADFALSDALVGFGDDAYYDSAKFLASMRGNGYRIIREPEANPFLVPTAKEVRRAALIEQAVRELERDQASDALHTLRALLDKEAP